MTVDEFQQYMADIQNNLRYHTESFVIYEVRFEEMESYFSQFKNPEEILEIAPKTLEKHRTIAYLLDERKKQYTQVRSTLKERYADALIDIYEAMQS
jgi:hypothetical protein